MADAVDWRSRNRELIFVCRVIRDRFGDEAVELLAAHHLKRVRESFREKSAAGGPNDLAALARNFGGNPETHTSRIVRQDDRVLEVVVTRCAHAEQFAESGARDIGLMFMCAGDEAMIEGFNPRITLERPKLLMRGDDCCHFIYRLED